MYREYIRDGCCDDVVMKEYKTDEQKKSFYNTNKWKQLREEALERDHYECLECKRNGFVTSDSVREDGKPKEVVLNVDHIKPIEYHPELSLELDNLQTLCIYHHNVKEGRVFYRKINKWEEDELDIL